jgi:YHS domain-containing protein
VTVRIFVFSMLVAVGPPAGAWAQHEGHQPAADEDASLAQCAQVQPVIQKLIDSALMRLENARQTNSAAELRAAANDVEGALRDLRAQLVPCTKTKVIDPHTGHAMPIAPAPRPSPAKPPAATPGPAKPPVAADPHAGHATSPPAKPSPATAKPMATKPGAEKSPAGDPHAGHEPQTTKPEAGAPAGAAEATDPVCGLKVDPASAPSARHNGQTYYFCSEQHQRSFQKDPAKYLPKP